jgi:FkbM family methyltransferase
MPRTLKELIRPFVPNLSMQIRHVEDRTMLEVRLRQHLGLITRGTKAYESRYVSVLRSLISKGDRVFDVGANIGFYSVLFSCWVGESGTVVAYEPDQNNLKLLRRNLELNNCRNVHVRDVALGNKSGLETFSRDHVTGSTGHLGAGPTYAETIFGNGRESLVQVNVATLDQEVDLHGLPTLVKLDIEGGEFDVLSGALRLLDQHRPIMVAELSSWNDDRTFGLNKAALAAKLMIDHDYMLWNMDSGREMTADESVWMVLAVPHERSSEPRIERALEKMRSAVLSKDE